jgi:N-acetylmuramoyl-L-alanine amidase
LVIKNRAAHPGWWGKDIDDVCLKPGQFSCWDKGDPNRQKCLDVTVADPAFALACTLADAIVGGQIADETRGATNYHTIAAPAGAVTWPPTWTALMTETYRDAAHVFYR